MNTIMSHTETDSYPARALSGLDLVIMRATTDPEFRAALLAAPRQAIETAFGITLPPSLRLRFCEKDTDVDLHVMLPDLVQVPGKLSLEHLDRIVGGQGAPSDDHWLASSHPSYDCWFPGVAEP
jgi:hypothetical protein